MSMHLVLSIFEGLMAGVSGIIGISRLLGANTIGEKIAGVMFIAASAVFGYFSIDSYRLHDNSIQETNDNKYSAKNVDSPIDLQQFPSPSRVPSIKNNQIIER